MMPTPSRVDLLKLYSSWVYDCASKNAETCMRIPLRLYATGGNVQRYSTRAGKKFTPTARKSADDVTEIVDGHPLLELLDHVNPYMTGIELQEAIILWQELTGDCFIYVENGPLGVPKNLWVLDSRWMKVVPDEKDYLLGYLYGRTSIDQIAFKPEEIIHLKYYNPSNPWYGLSPLEAVYGAVYLLNSEQEYEKSLYDNGGMPEVAVITKSPLNDKQREELRKDWRNRWGIGRKNTGVPAFLSGEVDIKTLSHPPRDMGVDVSKKFSRQDVCSAFGVPMTMIEMSEAAKAGAEAGNVSYLANTIAPKLARLDAQLTEQLAARYDGRLILQHEDCVPGDKTMRLSEIQTHLQTGYSTINEERAIDGLDPVEWGNEPVKPTITVAATPESDDMGDDDMMDDADEGGKPKKSVKAKRPTFEARVTDYFEAYGRDMVSRAREAL